MTTSTAARPAAELAKAALRRLTQHQLEPTPDNYARAYAQEQGLPPPAPAAAAGAPAEAVAVPLADWIDRVVRGLERGGRHWTTARKKDSLKRVLAAGRGDVQRLQQRLGQLLEGWDQDQPDSTLAELDDAPPPAAEPPLPGADAGSTAAPDAELPAAADQKLWGSMTQRLGRSVCAALPPADPATDPLAAELAALTEALLRDGGNLARAEALAGACQQADRLIEHRHQLVDQLRQLCGELTGSLTDLAEDDGWARGQCEAMQLKIDEGLTARGVRSVSELLRDTRARQGQLRREREQARLALKSFIHQMLNDLGELGHETGRFHESIGRYADVIERADTLESLAGVVREMVIESRTVQSLVGQAQQRLQAEHARAAALDAQVTALESELRRVSDEVSTDQLTQVANRRGLMSAFEQERARQARSGGPLCVALLDVDNFKRLNDDLGHGAGDIALRSLADLVRRDLRPTDHVARYGGEEFVLLMPDTPVAEAQQVLNRLQRALTGGLFMHENKQVFVTFSAGVTLYQDGEAIEATLDRADRALYEAKRSGKNRSCVA